MIEVIIGLLKMIWMLFIELLHIFPVNVIIIATIATPILIGILKRS